MMQLVNALNRAGYNRTWPISEPFVIAQADTGSPPIIVKNIYIGRGNTKTDAVDLRPLQLLHELGIDVKVCFNFDTKKLYDLDQVKTSGPIFQFTTGTVLTYKTKLRRLVKELKLVEDDPVQAGPIQDQIAQLKAKLESVGELDESLLLSLNVAENPVSVVREPGETVEQRMLRMAREGEEARESDKALFEMQRLITEDKNRPTKPLLDAEDAAAITLAMEHADLEAQNRYEQSLRDKEDNT
jgi:hypothetical protein